MVSSTRSMPRVPGRTSASGRSVPALNRERATWPCTACSSRTRVRKAAARSSARTWATKTAVVNARLSTSTASTAKVRRVTSEENIPSCKVLKLVPHTPHGGDHARIAAGRLDFLAHMLHVDVDGAAEALEIVAPHLIEQLLAGKHLPGRTRQRQQQIKLFGTQLNCPAAHHHRAARRIDGQRHEAQRGGLLRLRRTVGAPLQRLHPRDQFLGLEGLGEIVVGA